MKGNRGQLASGGQDDMVRRMLALGLPSPGPVVARIMELASDPRASASQYADAIRVDPVLSAKMLRMANSAFFAQRAEVSSLDRACVMLGVERVRGLALGFHLSRSSTGDGSEAISRTVWCQSIFRASLGGELARRISPMVGAEGFLIGLMLDAGIPLMHRMFGPVFEELWCQRLPPPALHALEKRVLPFTHQEVAVEMCRVWRLPGVLTEPISLHHTTPPAERTPENALWRVAHYVGSIRLDAQGTPQDEHLLPEVARSLFGLERQELGDVVRQASGVFDAVCIFFEHVSDTVDEPAQLSRHIEHWMRLAPRCSGGMVQQLQIAGVTVSLRRLPDAVSITTHDDRGEPVACAMRARHAPLDLTLNGLDSELGLDCASLDERIRLRSVFDQVRAA